MRIVIEPHVLEKFRRHLEPEMFSQADSKGVCEKIAGIWFDRTRTEKNCNMDSLYSWIQLLPSGEERDSVMEFFTQWRLDDTVYRLSKSDHLIDSFLQWLRSRVFLNSHLEVRDYFQRGMFEQSYKALEKSLGDIKAISLDAYDNADWDNSLQFLEDDANRIDETFKLGVPDFDSGSAFDLQTLNLAVGMTGSGKTMYTTHLIRQAVEQGEHMFVVILEDRKVSFLRRVYAAMTGIPLSEIKSWSQMRGEKRAKLEQARSQLRKYIRIEFMYGVPPDFVMARIRELNNQRKADGRPIFRRVVIDYLQHISHLGSGDSSHEKLAFAMAKLKDLALSENLTIWTHQQINRQGATILNKDGLITLDTLSGSFNVAFVCDTIISLNRSPDMKDRDEAVWYVIKGREGCDSHKYSVKTEFHCARFNTDNYMRLDADTI